jgi:hypothetical protein
VGEQTYVIITFPFLDFASVIGDPLGHQALKFAGRIWEYARNTTTLGFNDITSIAIRPIDSATALQATVGCASSQASQILAALAEAELCVRMSGDLYCTDALPATTEQPDTIMPTATRPPAQKAKLYQEPDFVYITGGILALLVVILVVMIIYYKRQRKEEEAEAKDSERFRDQIGQRFGSMDQWIAADSLLSTDS